MESTLLQEAQIEAFERILYLYVRNVKKGWKNVKVLSNRIFTGSDKVVWSKIQAVLKGLTAEDVISTNLISAGEGTDKDGNTVHYVTAQIYYQEEAAENADADNSITESE